MGITIVNLQNKRFISVKRIQDVAKFVLSSEGYPKALVSIAISTDNKIRKLNKLFLKRDRPTDVLAFSFVEGKFSKVNPAHLLGDVVVSIDTAIRNARRYKTDVHKELYLYVIHGLLHLVGYDDRTRRKQTIIRKKEQEYLKQSLEQKVKKKV